MNAPIIGELSSDSHGDLAVFGCRDDSVEFGAGCVADSGRPSADWRWNLRVLGGMSEGIRAGLVRPRISSRLGDLGLV